MPRVFVLYLLLTIFSAFPAFAEAKRMVNAVGCSLFDPNGKLLKKYMGWVCGYFPNGKMLLGDGLTLNFYDRKMNRLWSKKIHTHHMITYSEADKTALVIASHVVGDKRLDRLEVYDIDGKLLKHFNFTEKHSLGKAPQNWDLPAFSGVKYSLTVVESFYRIGKNTAKHPALKEGNYIVYDAFGRIYFFDSGLKKIVHTIDPKIWKKHHLRDLQVTKAGNILTYNSGNESDGKKFTTLEEIDLHTGKAVWSYQASPPESFYGAYEGNVQILDNGNVLFSTVMDEWKGNERRKVPKEELEPWMEIQGPHRTFEITRAGEVVWRMVQNGENLSGMPNVIKRLDLTEYYRNKGRY